MTARRSIWSNTSSRSAPPRSCGSTTTSSTTTPSRPRSADGNLASGPQFRADEPGRRPADIAVDLGRCDRARTFGAQRRHLPDQADLRRVPAHRLGDALALVEGQLDLVGAAFDECQRIAEAIDWR